MQNNHFSITAISSVMICSVLFAVVWIVIRCFCLIQRKWGAMAAILLWGALLSSSLLVWNWYGQRRVLSQEALQLNLKLLSTDIYVSIAQHHLVLPFIALEDYNRNRQSFSLNGKEDAKHAADAFTKLMRESIDPQNPKSFDRLSIVIDTYGWNDADTRQIQLCFMLTRQWARSACNNPWAAVQKSLPDRIELVDLRRLKIESPEPRMPRCVRNSVPRRAFPIAAGEAAMVCEAEIYGAEPGGLHVAVIRIDGDLGAVWTVSSRHRSGESAETILARQGEAIVAFVRHGLGSYEDFSTLHGTLCGLRPPMAEPGLRPDCGKDASSGVD